MDNFLQEMESKLHRLQAAEACRNLMGCYAYYYTAFRHADIASLWSGREDCQVTMPWGVYDGIEGVKTCYLKDHADRNAPDAEKHLKGRMLMHELDTEVLEVAADGQTAMGVWLSFGHETYMLKNSKARAQWICHKYAADFIVEDGEWKFWRMRVYPLYRADYGKSWVDAEQPDYGKTHAKLLDTPNWSYAKDRVCPASEPEPPLPYAAYPVGRTL